MSRWWRLRRGIDGRSCAKSRSAPRAMPAGRSPASSQMPACLSCRAFPSDSTRSIMKSLALLREGALGTVSLCRIRHGHGHGFEDDFRASWFVDPSRSGGGTLLDEGIHAADFLRWMFGEPSSVFRLDLLGQPRPRRSRTRPLATFRYDDGMLAEVSHELVLRRRRRLDRDLRHGRNPAPERRRSCFARYKRRGLSARVLARKRQMVRLAHGAEFQDRRLS